MGRRGSTEESRLGLEFWGEKPPAGVHTLDIEIQHRGIRGVCDRNFNGLR